MGRRARGKKANIIVCAKEVRDLLEFDKGLDGHECTGKRVLKVSKETLNEFYWSIYENDAQLPDPFEDFEYQVCRKLFDTIRKFKGLTPSAPRLKTPSSRTSRFQLRELNRVQNEIDVLQKRLDFPEPTPIRRKRQGHYEKIRTEIAQRTHYRKKMFRELAPQTKASKVQECVIDIISMCIERNSSPKSLCGPKDTNAFIVFFNRCQSNITLVRT